MSTEELYKDKVSLASSTINKLGSNFHFIEGGDVINSLVVKGKELNEISKDDLFKEVRALLHDNKSKITFFDEIGDQNPKKRGVDTHICKTCEQELPESGFDMVRSSNGRKYPDSMCKKCRRAAQKERYRTDPEYRKKMLGKSRRYRKKAYRDPKKREKMKERSKRWYHENKDNPEFKERSKKYRKEYYERKKQDPEFMERMRESTRISHKKRRDAQRKDSEALKERRKRNSSIRSLHRTGKYSQKKLASMFNLGQSGISYIINEAKT